MATPELHASCSASRWSNFAFRLSFSSIRSLSEPIFIWIHRPCWLDTNHRVLQPNSRCCKRRILCLRMHACVTKTGPPKGSTQPGWNGRGRNGGTAAAAHQSHVAASATLPTPQAHNTSSPAALAFAGRRNPLKPPPPACFDSAGGGGTRSGEEGASDPIAPCRVAKTWKPKTEKQDPKRQSSFVTKADRDRETHRGNAR